MNILELKNEIFPHWYFERVLRPEDIENFQFYFYDGYVSEEIFVHNIVGTTHVNYYHKAWLEMLCSLKRHRQDYNTELIKQIILLKNDDKSVKEYNGKYYITEGNHRCCQAKFLAIEKIYCIVEKYKFNHLDYNIYNELVSNNFSCNYSSGNFKDIKIGDTNIYVQSTEDVIKLIETYKSIRIRKSDRLSFLLKNIFSSNNKHLKPVRFLHIHGNKNFHHALKKVMILMQHQSK